MSEKPEKRYLKRDGPVWIVFYHKQLPWFVSELPEKDLRRGDPVYVVFYNKLPWFVSELPEKDLQRSDPV